MQPAGGQIRLLVLLVRHSGQWVRGAEGGFRTLVTSLEVSGHLQRHQASVWKSDPLLQHPENSQAASPREFRLRGDSRSPVLPCPFSGQHVEHSGNLGCRGRGGSAPPQVTSHILDLNSPQIWVPADVSPAVKHGSHSSLGSWTI